uniref:Uncharacterized protein LOC117350837 n=1 Tax=Geotrypetes seraphini TaxID=260995 RepID=A0A6P8NXY9_GEOSA|nr:uncharacterized protein LOC117350837 [Geotrypetes seraphini]
MLGLLLFLYTSAVQGELFCTKRREFLVGACGDTISLPCNFSWEGLPFTKFELVWQKKSAGSTLVVHHEDMRNSPNLYQNRSFRNRTLVKDGWPQSTDITLMLSNITGIDRGVYTCEIFTLTPYSRKSCAEIQLDVLTDAVGLGLGISVAATAGASVHLPCFSKLGCSNSTHRLHTSWTFSKRGSDLGAELASSAHPLMDAGFSLSHNGTLNLQGVKATDAGIYSCHLAGQSKVAEILLEVTGPVKTKRMVVRLVAFILIALFFGFGMIIGWKICISNVPKQNPAIRPMMSHEEKDSALTESDKNVNWTCSSIKPLIAGQTDILELEA